MRTSWTRLARAYLLPYVAAILTMIAAVIVGRLKWSNSLYYFEDLKFATGTGQGALTVLNGLMLAAAGALFSVVAHQLPLVGLSDGNRRSVAADRAEDGSRLPRLSRPWLAFAVLAVVLAIDEVLMAHEYVSYRLDSGGVPKLFGLIDQDFFVFSIYGLLVLAVLSYSLETIIEFGSNVLPLCAFGLFMILSQLIDFVPWAELTRTQQQILGPAEEALKSLGCLSLLLYALVLAADVIDKRASAARGVPRV